VKLFNIERIHVYLYQCFFFFFFKLSEIGEGVWCCPVKVKSLISSNYSRRALACSLLSLFYPTRELKGKRLQDLDQKVVTAIADFAVVAKIKSPDAENEEGVGKKGYNNNVTRGKVMQALRGKCNGVIFNRKNPTYHKGIIYMRYYETSDSFCLCLWFCIFQLA